MFFAKGTDTPGYRGEVDMQRLEAFYQRHRLFEKFIFPHPQLGNVTVRFSKPLEYKILENGNGLTEPFTMELLSQP